MRIHKENKSCRKKWLFFPFARSGIMETFRTPPPPLFFFFSILLSTANTTSIFSSPYSPNIWSFLLSFSLFPPFLIVKELRFQQNPSCVGLCARAIRRTHVLVQLRKKNGGREGRQPCKETALLPVHVTALLLCHGEPRHAPMLVSVCAISYCAFIMGLGSLRTRVNEKRRGGEGLASVKLWWLVGVFVRPVSLSVFDLLSLTFVSYFLVLDIILIIM